jgi:hypothetical protein
VGMNVKCEPTGDFCVCKLYYSFALHNGPFSFGVCFVYLKKMKDPLGVIMIEIHLTLLSLKVTRHYHANIYTLLEPRIHTQYNNALSKA